MTWAAIAIELNAKNWPTSSDTWPKGLRDFYANQLLMDNKNRLQWPENMSIKLFDHLFSSIWNGTYDSNGRIITPPDKLGAVFFSHIMMRQTEKADPAVYQHICEKRKTLAPYWRIVEAACFNKEADLHQFLSEKFLAESDINLALKICQGAEKDILGEKEEYEKEDIKFEPADFKLADFKRAIRILQSLATSMSQNSIQNDVNSRGTGTGRRVTFAGVGETASSNTSKEEPTHDNWATI